MSGKEWSPWNLPNERGGRRRIALQDSGSAPQWSNKFSRGTKKALLCRRRWLNCDEVDVEKLSYVAASKAIFGFPAATEEEAAGHSAFELRIDYGLGLSKS